MASTITRPSYTDDDGSGTTGTILSVAVFTDIFDKIDAMFAGGGAYATFAFGGAVSSVNGFSAISTSTVTLAAGASGSVGTTSNHDFYLKRNGSNIWQIDSANQFTRTTAPTNYQYAGLSLLDDLYWLQMGSDARAVLQGANAATNLAYNMVRDPAGAAWRNLANASVSMLQLTTGTMLFYADTSPGAAYTSFTPTIRFKVDTATVTCYRDLLASAHNTYDLGKTGTRWAAGWFQGAVTAAGGFVGDLTGVASGNLVGNGFSTSLSFPINTLVVANGLVTSAT